MYYQILIHHRAEPLNIEHDNVDVEVLFPSVARYSATFFTLANIRLIMERYQTTGECAGGLFFWAKNAIIIRDLAETTIRATVDQLIQSGEFESAFERLPAAEETVSAETVPHGNSAGDT
jgi:hypothetical protein